MLGSALMSNILPSCFENWIRINMVRPWESITGIHFNAQNQNEM